MNYLIGQVPNKLTFPNSQENYFVVFFFQRHSIHGMMEEENVIRPHQQIKRLSWHDKKFLIAVERGDVATTTK